MRIQGDWYITKKNKYIYLEDKIVTRTFNKLLKILFFLKTYPSGMEEKLSLNTYIGIPKRFHCIHSQTRIGLRSISLLHMLSRKSYIRTISTSSELEPVLIYTNPEGHKGLIAKQNKGKSGVYR